MTDQELVALLGEKTPDELSEEEIDLLRRRIAESAELREALYGQLQMEAYLAAALARVNFSPGDILKRARQHQQSQSRAAAFYLGIPLAVLALVGMLFLFREALSGRGRKDERAVADAKRIIDSRPKEKPTDQEDKSTRPPADDGAADDGPQDDGSSRTKASPEGGNPLAATKSAAPTAAAPAEPWREVMALQEGLPTFAQEAFRTFDVQRQLPRRADLLAWFEAVPGHNHRITEVDTQRGKCGQLEGVARLKAPWTDDSALKLSLENYNKLQMHFYCGQQGVTLVYYEDQQYRWAAYATTREAGKARPATLAVTATDDDRCRRTELRFGGPIEIRHRGRELILSRGNIVLLSAPLAGPPQDVYFEGRAAFHGIELVRTTDDPQSLPPLPVVFETARPAELSWTSTQPEIAQPQAQPDGSLRLAADKSKQQVECYAPLPATGLCEVIVELDDITPGTGVYLGGDKGAAHEVLRFHLDRRTKQLAARVRGNDNAHEETFEEFKDRPAPLIGSHCFVRMLFGAGNLRTWLSVDGEHWAQVDPAADGRPPIRPFLGLQVVANRPDSHLALKRIVMRELAGLAALAPAELRQQPVAAPEAKSIGDWLVEVTRKQPAGVEAAAWRRACAVRTLGAAAGRELAYALLELLLDDAAARKLPAAQQLAAFHDAMLLAFDLRDGGSMRVGLATRYLQLGRRAFDEEGLPPWSTIQQAAMSAPALTQLQQPPAVEENLRWELIDAVSRRSPQETLELCRQWRFFQLQQKVPLVDWAEAAARRDAPGAGGESIARLKDGWRPLLVEDVSRETYNAITEIGSVVESEAWEDAARMITSVQPGLAAGVAPWLHDKELLVSLPVAIRLMLDRHQPLRQSLTEGFGPLARLRTSQATSAGDAAAVEMIAVQFAGSQHAAEAHRWLGDQALASGWFERAIGEYRRAAAAAPSLAAELSPRIRLAAAMLGRDAESPATQEVRVGEMAVSKEQFEALVAEMRSRPAASLVAAARIEAALPKPSALQAQLKARLDGAVGEKPQEQVVRRTNQYRVPWADRQIATALEGDVLYVSNRFQVAAYNLASGQRLWQSPPPPGPVRPAQDWAMIPMRPLVTPTHIFARQLYGSGPMLVCLRKQDGGILWSTTQSEREFVASDPLLVQGQLVALSIQVQEGQEGLLRWNVFDPATGEVQQSRDLVRMRNTWGAHSCCEVTVLDDSLVVVLGGATMSVDAAGAIRWIRKQVVLPGDEEPRWLFQLYQPPLVDGERMFVAQPGVRSIDCLDVRAGSRHWISVLPDLLNIVGLAGDKLIVRTESDLRALDAASGKLLWRQAAGDLHSFQLCGEGGILCARREPVPDKKDALQTRLVWLDPASGNELGSAVVPQLVDADPRLGPLVVYKDRLWTFFGKGQHDPTRDVVELSPAGEAEMPLAAQGAGNVWLREVPPPLAAAAGRVAPQWQVLSGLGGERTGLVAEAHGEKDVLGARTNGAWPVALARAVTIPAGAKARLRMRLGNDPGQNWKLEVRFGDQVVHAVDITDQTHPDRWKTIEADLSSLAGQTGMLVVTGRFVSGGDQTATFWKSLELLF